MSTSLLPDPLPPHPPHPPLVEVPDEPPPLVEVPDEGGPRNRGRTSYAVAALVAVALVAVGVLAGPATPVGSYRPELLPPALQGACWPLPPSTALQAAFVLRSDTRVTDQAGHEQRRLDLHIDRADPLAVRNQLVADLVGAGWRATEPLAGADPGADVWLARPGWGRVGLGAQRFDVPEDSVVRGSLAIDLPVRTYDAQGGIDCGPAKQSKRWDR